VINTEGSIMVAPDEKSNEVRSSDKIVLQMADAKVYDEEGELMEADDIEVDDIVKITYSGEIMESYPAQIICKKLKVIDHDILLDGYMAVIDDIYKLDDGLNAEITTIAVDTSTLTNLTEEEKERLLTMIGDKYGLTTIAGTFDELAEEGLIDKENLYFEEGIHIIIENPEYDRRSETLTCGIKKWRSGLGAIGADDVTAEFNGSTWEVTRKNEWIS
jgi:hypothetical protein